MEKAEENEMKQNENETYCLSIVQEKNNTSDNLTKFRRGYTANTAF